MEGFSALRVQVEEGIAWVTIDHPPIQLFDLTLITEMDRLGRALEADPAVRVVVMRSADPDFFIAHADVRLILSLPAPEQPAAEPSFFQQMVDRFRTMPKATIAVIEGICRGGGSELVLSMDMRFAALGRAVLGQPEVAVGIVPGGSGTQRLPRLVGRGRALEIARAGGSRSESPRRATCASRSCSARARGGVGGRTRTGTSRCTSPTRSTPGSAPPCAIGS